MHGTHEARATGGQPTAWKSKHDAARHRLAFTLVQVLRLTAQRCTKPHYYTPWPYDKRTAPTQPSETNRAWLHNLLISYAEAQAPEYWNQTHEFKSLVAHRQGKLGMFLSWMQAGCQPISTSRRMLSWQSLDSTAWHLMPHCSPPSNPKSIIIYSYNTLYYVIVCYIILYHIALLHYITLSLYHARHGPHHEDAPALQGCEVPPHHPRLHGAGWREIP